MREIRIVGKKICLKPSDRGPKEDEKEFQNWIWDAVTGQATSAHMPVGF